jgi:2-methylisocitrate lyase-like PEP mutase family enzyme
MEGRAFAFRALHESGCFVLPNPWDVGAARFLEGLGFRALASTSAGFAFTRGLPDNVAVLTRELVLAHLGELVAATRLPVNADFQNGYGKDARSVAESVKLCVATGVAGLSIEDATGDPARPLFELNEAVERLRAARAAIDETKTGVVLTARAECFLVGHPDPLAESIRRLRAYVGAGADVLYAPGLRDRDAIRAVVAAVAPKPVNVLVPAAMGLSVADLAELGVRRISVGSALARVAWTAFTRAARVIAEKGEFSGFEGVLSTGDVSRFFC